MVSQFVGSHYDGLGRLGSEDDWDPTARHGRGVRERPPAQGLNWLAVATLAALLAGPVAMVFAGLYARSVGYPPISFDHDFDYLAPTDLQNRVKGVGDAGDALTPRGHRRNHTLRGNHSHCGESVSPRPSRSECRSLR